MEHPNPTIPLKSTETPLESKIIENNIYFYIPELNFNWRGGSGIFNNPREYSLFFIPPPVFFL